MMTDGLTLRRKWTFRAHGKQVVFAKKKLEKNSHVLMKAFLWALYLPDYPDLSVEVPVGLRYRPDVVQVNQSGAPVFWGESERVSVRKIRYLLTRCRRTHFALARWNTDLAPFETIVQKAMAGVGRQAPVDLLSFPADSTERFISADGDISIRLTDVTWIRL